MQFFKIEIRNTYLLCVRRNKEGKYKTLQGIELEMGVRVTNRITVSNESCLIKKNNHFVIR